MGNLLLKFIKRNLLVERLRYNKLQMNISNSYCCNLNFSYSIQQRSNGEIKMNVRNQKYRFALEIAHYYGVAYMPNYSLNYFDDHMIPVIQVNRTALEENDEASIVKLI